MHQFSSLVIASFGFDTFNTLLYTIPMAAVALVFLFLSAFTCNRFRGLRCYWMIITLLISLIGILLMRQLPVEKKWGRLVGVWLVTVFGAGFPLSLSLVSSNFAGFTKKTTVTAILFIGYCVGNIAGPQLFKKNQAPHYYVSYFSFSSFLYFLVFCFMFPFLRLSFFALSLSSSFFGVG